MKISWKGLDESILLMRKLIELDPESIMARTNLSVLYMKKGMKNESGVNFSCHSN